MQYSKFDMFLDKEAIPTETVRTATPLAFGYNRNMEDKIYLSVHATASNSATIALETSESTASGSTWKKLREWATVVPNADGYMVLEKLPKGVKNFLRLTVSTVGGANTVTAGLVLEQDLDFDLADRDPTAVFDGTTPPQTI